MDRDAIINELVRKGDVIEAVCEVCRAQNKGRCEHRWKCPMLMAICNIEAVNADSDILT